MRCRTDSADGPATVAWIEAAEERLRRDRLSGPRHRDRREHSRVERAAIRARAWHRAAPLPRSQRTPSPVCAQVLDRRGVERCRRSLSAGFTPTRTTQRPRFAAARRARVLSGQPLLSRISSVTSPHSCGRPAVDLYAGVGCRLSLARAAHRSHARRRRPDQRARLQEMRCRSPIVCASGVRVSRTSSRVLRQAWTHLHRRPSRTGISKDATAGLSGRRRRDRLRSCDVATLARDAARCRRGLLDRWPDGVDLFPNTGM